MTLKKKVLITIELIKIAIKLLVIGASIVFLAWLAWSFLEVQIHNFTIESATPYEYSSINFFGKMLEWFPCK